MLNKQKNNFLVRDMVRGMKQQGIADEDILDIMGKAGVPSDMTASIVGRVTEELELQGIKSRKSIAREEIDSALWEVEKELETALRELEERLDTKEELLALKSALEDISSSIKSFEIYAGEILKALKK